MERNLRNLHACLVHESRECVIDLVRNLHHLDPGSMILLYNGGADAELLANVSWDRYNAVVHPRPRRMKWGWLHDFALDCMRFGLESMPFDTMTIVDSDQLGLRAGYAEHLAGWLAGRDGIGMLGSVQAPAQAADRRTPLAPPAAHAMREIDLWRPYLRRFEGGEAKFVHWTFWPTTVFTTEAARRLLEMWADPMLARIIERTKIWASEEVILPTLVALSGLKVDVNPCRHDYVRYRVRYSTAQLDAGMANPQVFWAHPIPRRLDDPLRAHVRRKLGDYRPAPERQTGEGLLGTLPILDEVRAIGGWLADEEADLLIATAARALGGEGPHAFVEIGSFCGKATVALGRTARRLGMKPQIHAIDPHDGVVGSRDGRLERHPPTRDIFLANVARAGLSDLVNMRQARATEVNWDGPIALLLVDGLHDYQSVAADFHHFERFLTPTSFVAFHDYADYFPGVERFVDELVRSGAWAIAQRAGSLVVLRRRAPAPAVIEAPTAGPLVSCIMPTANRRRYVAHAIRHFLAQDYPERELVIVDDGADTVGDLVPADPRIRYLKIEGRRTVGAKRNLACAAASGSIIVHWDDDDWMAPWRLTYQVRELLAAGAPIAGLDNVHYFHAASEQAYVYRYPPGARRWAAGNTLCYRRAHWQRHPFADVDVGEDARFVWADRTATVRTHAETRFFVALIHDANVARKQTQSRYWHPVPAATIASIMGEDYAVYRALAQKEPA